MEGIKNLLLLLNDNWTTILVCVGLIIGVVQRGISYFTKTDKERIEIAKSQVREIILNMIMNAEMDYQSWDKAGEIKRSQVIGQIFEQYPILSKVTNQDDIINWLDNEIDNALKTLEDFFAKNNAVG